MAFVGLRVPHDAARLFETVDVPGERLSASDMHITMFYLGKDVPIEVVARAMVVAHGVTSSRTPFLVEYDEVSSFPAGPDGVPIICPVRSLELHRYRQSLKEAFEAGGVPFSNKHPDYRPHTTLSYYVPGPGEEGFSYSAKLPGPLSFTALELTIWGGDDGDGVVHVGIPFVLSPLERIARRLVR